MSAVRSKQCLNKHQRLNVGQKQNKMTITESGKNGVLRCNSISILFILLISKPKTSN